MYGFIRQSIIPIHYPNFFAKDLYYFLIFLKRKGASSVVITSSCVFSAHFLRKDIVILVFCTLCVEVQGESSSLSMECASPIFSGIECDIEGIVSIKDTNSFMYNLRRRKSSTQGCAPPCNCTKEYHFITSGSLSVVIEFSNLFANYSKR